MVLPKISDGVHLIIILEVEFLTLLSLVHGQLFIFVAVLDHDAFKLSGSENFVLLEDTLIKLISVPHESLI